MSELLIEARRLTKRYGDHTVVDELDLSVAAGEVFGLLGPNGAGKTTTILMLLGLTERTSGTARVAGFDPAREALDVKAVVGYLPDNVGFYGGLTGRQNLRYTTLLNRLPDAVAVDRIDRVLDEVGLAYAADAKVETYSRGMRQRLGIADALVKEPHVLVLDEPTIAIDPDGVAEIQELIRRLAEERQVAVLLSSHLLYQMQAVCDRVGIFVGGRMVKSGSTDQLMAAASGPATYELLVGGVDGRVAEILGAVPGVTSVERRREHGSWEIVGGTDLAPLLAAAVVAAGLELRRLRPLGSDLDEVYRRFFAEEAVR